MTDDTLLIRVCEAAKWEGRVRGVNSNVGADEYGADLVVGGKVAVVREDAHKVCDASTERGDCHWLPRGLGPGPG